MTEADLINRIKEQRRRAINRADREKARNFLYNPVSYQKRAGKAIIILFLVLIMIAATMEITYSVFKSADKPKIIYQKEVIKQQQIINNITEETTVINRVENVIKGDQQMTCLQKKNSREIVCYKESDQ